MAITEIIVGSKGFKKEGDGSTPVIVYKFENITPQEAQKLAEELLVNPVTQQGLIDQPVDGVEISYMPGVMNRVKDSLMRGARNLGIKPVAVGTSRVYLKSGKPSDIYVSQVEEVVKEKPKTLILDRETPGVEVVKVRGLDDSELLGLSKDRSLSLDLIDMRAVQKHGDELGRDFNDIEVETVAQTWSDHNYHGTFKSEFMTPDGVVKKAPIKRLREESEKHYEKAGVVTAFADNSGGIRFGGGYAIIVKIETHNFPVSVEPEGGSETGIGGVKRDIAGTGRGGGKNLFAIVMNSFGNPHMPQDEVNEGCLHPRLHLEGNAKGQSSYGNKMGVPTLLMVLHFDDDFAPKPISMGGTIGLIEEKNVQKGDPEIGDFIITVGGKTGKDGIHGATGSSMETNLDTKRDFRTAVQMGNAIEQKRMFDALEECAKQGLIRAITDCGGGGYSSAIGEIGEKIGVEVDLDKVPLKYQGLAPWQIWLSESQERMIVALDPTKWEEFKEICEVYEVPADVIGKFTGDKMLRLKYKDEVVGELSMDFLHNGKPKRVLPIAYKEKSEVKNLPSFPSDFGESYKKVLGHLNICSKEKLFRRYDHTVGGRTALSPLLGVNQDVQPDAAVVKAFYDKPYGIVTACALNSALMRLDPYEGTIWAFSEALAKYVAVGGNQKGIAALDNYVWPANTAYTLGALDQSIDAVTLMLRIFGIPIVSGKDSMSMTYRKKDGTVVEAPYTLNITLFGKIPDVARIVTPEFKKPGSIICVVGNPVSENLGGSIYLDTCKVKNNQIPQIDLKDFANMLDVVHSGINEGKIKACKAIGEGGIAVALSQMCFASGMGASVDLGVFGVRPDLAFYNENPGFLVELEGINDLDIFEDTTHKVIGVTSKKPSIKIVNQYSTLCNVSLDELREAWQWKY